MTSAIGVAILVVVGIWLFGSLLARWAGVLLVVALGVLLWLAGHLLYRIRRGVWKSVSAERVFSAATAGWRNDGT
jgi:hypothetical protein